VTTYDETEGNPGFLRYRVDQLESHRRDIDKWRDDVDDDRRDLKYLRREVKDLTDAVDDLKKILVRASVTVAGSAIMLLISALVSSGHI
jgi:septal ring factor EnvC (AmiA/AmiB activator)